MHVVNISFLLIRWGVFKIKKRKKSDLWVCFFIYRGQDLNLHALQHLFLSQACLPIPSPRRNVDFLAGEPRFEPG